MNKLETLFGLGWYTKLRPFLESDEFKKIGHTLKDLKNVTPSFDKVFKAFQLCPYEKLKVVILTNNPHNLEMDGLALSGRSDSDSPLSGEGFGGPGILDSVTDAIQIDFPGIKFEYKGIPDRWATQGVLLLNTDLTSIKGSTNVHNDLWRPFIEFVMKTLAEYNNGIIYCLLGKKAEEYRKFINLKSNDIIPLEHPMISIIKGRTWQHGGMFEYINRVSNLINNEKINW